MKSSRFANADRGYLQSETELHSAADAFGTSVSVGDEVAFAGTNQDGLAKATIQKIRKIRYTATGRQNRENVLIEFTIL